jgi:3-hydroxyacyl-CoA dehydrogenase
MAGIRVRILDTTMATARNCVDRIELSLGLFAEFGLLSEPIAEVLGRIEPVSMEGFPESAYDCSFIIEAVPEILGEKRTLFKQLDACPEDSILCSNTSSFTITSIADGMRSARRVVGLHHFMPAEIIPLVEIHRGRLTEDRAVESTRQLMLRVGKKPIVLRKEIPGFVVNRIQAAMGRECDYLIEQGITTPEELDLAAVCSFGLRLAQVGPIMMGDIQGLDTILQAKASIYKSLCSTTEVSPDFKERVESGAIGLKAGKGYYDWAGQRPNDVLQRTNRALLRQLSMLRETQSWV